MELNPHLDLPLEEYIQKNIKLGHKIANRYRKYISKNGLDYDEILNLALVGMMKAYRKFDPTKFEKVTKFSTYAVPMMIGEVQRFIRDFNPGAKFPRSIKEAAMRILKLNWLSKEPEWIYDELRKVPDTVGKGITLERVKDALEYLHIGVPRSTDEVVYENDGQPITLGEQLSDKADFSAIFVDEFLSTLKSKERKVMELRLQGKGQKEIGNAVGVSQVQVSRLLTKVGHQLKKYMKEEEEMARYKGSGDVTKAKELLGATTMTYKEIEEATGVPQGTVAYFAKSHRSEKVRKQQMKKNQVVKKGMQQEHKGNTDLAVQMLAEGKYTYADIAKRTGVPQGSLTRLRRMYESGNYEWTTQPAKRVEIPKEVKPVETPIIKEKAFMGDKDIEKAAEKAGVTPAEYDPNKEYEMVEKKEESQPKTIGEAIKEYEEAIRKQVAEEMAAKMTTESEAQETSKGKINRKVTFSYNGDGTEIPLEDFIAELNDVISNLKASGNKQVAFDLSIKAE